MWRARRWRKLLNLIDHLPRHTYYAQAVAEDPDHMAAIEKAVGSSEASGPAPLPKLAWWTPEVDKLTDVLDAIRSLQDVLIRVNVEAAAAKKMKPPEPTPRPGRPRIAGDRVKPSTADQMARHKSIVARMLPHKADSTD